MKKIIFLFLLILFLLPLNKAYAQTRLDISTTPIVLDLNSEPGKVIRDRVRIRNNTSDPLSLKVEVKKMAAVGDQGEVVPQDIGPGDDFISWIKFDPVNFSARPREWTDIGFTISIPKEAAFGYYYAIFISQTDTNEPNKTASKILGGITIPLLLNVKSPGAKAAAGLVDFKAVNFINENLPVEFITKVEALGNVAVKPRGNIFIRGSSNQDLAILEVNQALGNILPNSKRTFAAFWNDGFLVNEPIIEDGTPKTDSKGNVISKLTIHWDKLTSFRFGKFSASLILVYDDGTRDVPLEATIEFWVIPYKLIIILLVGLIALFLILRFALKAYVKHEMQKYRN